MLSVNTFINSESSRNSFSVPYTPTKFSDRVKHTLKKVLPTLIAAGLLLCHSCLGAFIFWKIENSLPIKTNTVKNIKNCLSNQTYFHTLYQTNIVTVALGYNRIRPCTIAGRGFSCLYCWLGIPIVVEVLSKFGEAVEFILQNLWVVYLKLRAGCETRKKLEQPNKSFDQPIPVLFGLAISISWIILSAYFVDYAEGLSFYLSLTFTIRTITRIAPTFGKHNPTAYLFEQLFVFWIGLTLFSATIKILQSNLLNLVEMLTSDINKDYKEAQLAGESGNDPDSEAKVEKKYEKMLKSSGAILSKLLSSHDQKLVREKMEKFARLKVASVQAVPDCQDQEIDAVPVRIDQSNAIRNGFHILIDTFDNLPNKLTGGFRFPSK